MRACEYCGASIEGRARNAKFCDRYCQVAAWRQSAAYRAAHYRPDDRHTVTGTCIRFDPDLRERLLAEADLRGLSVNWIVNRLVREGLDRLIPADQLSLTREPT